MPKPKTVSFNDYLITHREEFVPFELWLSDSLSDHLVAKRNLDPAYTSVVTDIDEDEPVGKVQDNAVQIRINGRFFIPKTDELGNELGISADKWIEEAQEWFDENNIEATFDEEATDLIKFTAFVEALELPEGSGEPSETPDEGPDQVSEDREDREDLGAEQPEEPEAEPGAPEEPEEPEESEEPEEPKPADEEEDAGELAEFEKALGL